MSRGLIFAPDGSPAWIKAVQNNWYEASRWSPNRSWVWFPVQDARKDLDRFTRYELSKHGRYLWKNSPLMRGLTERLVTLTIGSGVNPFFKSASNPKWAERAQVWWDRRSRNINLGPKYSFSQYQRCAARARFVDGEAFSIKTFDEDAMEDRIQGLESDAVTGAGAKADALKLMDGLQLNRQGCVLGYKFRNVDEVYPADVVIHHYTPNRFMQYRGETIFAAAINTARDVDDILALEKQCVKDASARKDIIKTATGELNPESIRSMRYTQAPSSVPFGLPDDPKAKEDYYRIRMGAESVLLQTGDEYTPYKPDRPGSAWQGFMAFLANTICISTGFPPSVVLPIDVGGTDIRRDNDVAQRVVEPWQLDIAAESELIVDYFMEPEIADGVLKGAPDDRFVKWHFPRKINVDRAQAQQDREDYRAGLLSGEEYHGQYGDDGDAYDQAVVLEVKRRKDRIKAAGFESVEEYIKFLTLGETLAKPAAAAPQKAGAQNAD